MTDVAGGFGLGDHDRRAARGRIERGEVPEAVRAQLPTDLDAAAYVLGLLTRYHGTAYHEIVSRTLGRVANHPLTLRTSHGHAGNMGPGWALDVANEEPIAPALAEEAQRSLGELVHATALANAVPPTEVVIVPHRASSAQRAQDPGRDVWRQIVNPVLAATGARGGYNTAAGSGRPIPQSWDLL